MQLCMIGSGQTGASMVRRLLRDGHVCVVPELAGFDGQLEKPAP